MKKMFSVPPKIFQKIFPETIWESRVNKILLTFDDGPNPETTPIILKKLEEHSIKAIFFSVGDNAKKYPELAKQIITEGHIIGNHTMYHQNINFLNRNVQKNIQKCSEVITEVVGEIPSYFRPPHGRVGLRTEKILKKHGLKNIMWSLLTYDYKNDINIVKFGVKKYLKENSIIVLHDSIKSKEIIADAIDFIVNSANAKEYEIGEPNECLK